MCRKLNMRLSKIVLMLFGMALMSSWASYADTLQCSDEGDKYPLFWRTPNQSVRVDEITFATPHFVQPVLACARWLENLPAEFWADESKLKFIYLYSAGGTKAVRFQGERAQGIRQACVDDEYCRLTFPTNLYPSFIFQGFRQQISSFRERSRFCFAATSHANLKRKDISFQEFYISKLKNTRTWNTAKDSFADIAQTISRDVKSGMVVMSSLTISKKELGEFLTIATQNPKRQLLLLVDFMSWISEVTEKELDELLISSIGILPVFNHPDRQGVYHIKGLYAFDGSERFLFTSANLRNQSESRLVDLGLNGRGGDLATMLRRQIMGTADSVCQNKDYLDCSLNARFQPNDPRLQKIHQLVENSCALWESAKKREGNFTVESSKQLLLSDQHDVTGKLMELIDRAKESIQISTDYFNHHKLWSTILRAEGRGVRVQLLIGSRHVNSHEEDPWLLHKGVVVADQGGSLMPHAKFVLVDRKWLLFGTGNLTVSGLERSQEAFFVTSDSSLIEASREYLKLFLPPG